MRVGDAQIIQITCNALVNACAQFHCYSCAAIMLKNRSLKMKTMKRVLNSYVTSILLYGSECWTISSQMRDRLQATEMWFYRHMMRIAWTEHKRNEEVLRIVDAQSNIIRSEVQLLDGGMENTTSRFFLIKKTR